MRAIVLFLACAAACSAWHDPVHARITKALLDALPMPMRTFFESETNNLILRYCLYPDRFANATSERKAELRPYCEVEGRPIHNVTWRRGEDLQSLEYLLSHL